MALSKQIRRELEVAFSRHAQPPWFRVSKYILIIVLFYFFWGQAVFWIILLIMFGIGVILHIWYRHKTEGWTKSYGMWDYEKNKSRLQ